MKECTILGVSSSLHCEMFGCALPICPAMQSIYGDGNLEAGKTIPFGKFENSVVVPVAAGLDLPAPHLQIALAGSRLS
jgi:hypothetical protein